MDKVLITGGAGFIGSQLGCYLDNKGYDVYLLDNMKHGHEDNLEVDGKMFGTFIKADIRDTNLTKYTEGMDLVVHLAGLSSLPLCQSKPMYAVDVNVGGTANVLEACRLTGVKKVIFASTGALYENNLETPFSEDLTVNPFLIYPASKYQAEKICDCYEISYGMDIVRLRFFNVYGPHQDFKRKQPPFTGYLLKQFLGGEDVKCFSDGQQRRDYIHINDLTRLIEKCFTSGAASNRVINACSGKHYSVNEIATKLMELFNIKVKIHYQDEETYWDNHPVLHEGCYPIKRHIVASEVNKFCSGDAGRAMKLGWKPEVSLEEGLQTLVDYARKIS